MVENSLITNILYNPDMQAAVFAVGMFTIVTALHFKFWHLYPQK